MLGKQISGVAKEIDNYSRAIFIDASMVKIFFYMLPQPKKIVYYSSFLHATAQAKHSSALARATLLSLTHVSTVAD